MRTESITLSWAQGIYPTGTRLNNVHEGRLKSIKSLLEMSVAILEGLVPNVILANIEDPSLDWRTDNDLHQKINKELVLLIDMNPSRGAVLEGYYQALLVIGHSVGMMIVEYPIFQTLICEAAVCFADPTVVSELSTYLKRNYPDAIRSQIQSA